MLIRHVGQSACCCQSRRTRYGRAHANAPNSVPHSHSCYGIPNAIAETTMTVAIIMSTVVPSPRMSHTPAVHTV